MEFNSRKWYEESGYTILPFADFVVDSNAENVAPGNFEDLLSLCSLGDG